MTFVTVEHRRAFYKAQIYLNERKLQTIMDNDPFAEVKRKAFKRFISVYQEELKRIGQGNLSKYMPN